MGIYFLKVVVWLVPLGLLILLCCRLTDRRQQFLEFILQHRLAITVIFVTVAWLIFGLPWVLGDTFDLTGQGWRFWLQTLAGNWSPDGFPPFSDQGATPERSTPVLSNPQRYWFVFSATVAVLLNNATIIIIIGLIWRLITELRTVMNLRQAFATKDQMIQQALIDEFSDDEETLSKIQRAFEKGEARWMPHARAMFGKKKANQFFSRHDIK
jgi:hypothetical protein